MPEDEPRGLLDRVERLESERRARKAKAKPATKDGLDLDRIG